MNNKRVLALALVLLVAFAMMPMAGLAGETETNAATIATTATTAKPNDIVILGTSDVRCGIDQNKG